MACHVFSFFVRFCSSLFLYHAGHHFDVRHPIGFSTEEIALSARRLWRIVRTTRDRPPWPRGSLKASSSTESRPNVTLETTCSP